MRMLALALFLLVLLGAQFLYGALTLHREAHRLRERLPFECPRGAVCRAYSEGEVAIEVGERRWVVVEVPR